jgi:hypothetical protein
MIEQYYPTLPKIELNRRGPARPNWDAWGNESGERLTTESGTNQNPKGTDARQASTSVPEPASAESSAPLAADAGSPVLSEIILPGVAPTFEHIASFVDLTPAEHGKAS